MPDPTSERRIDELIERHREEAERVAEREDTIVRLVKDADEMRQLQQQDHTTMTKLRKRITELEKPYKRLLAHMCGKLDPDDEPDMVAIDVIGQITLLRTERDELLAACEDFGTGAVVAEGIIEQFEKAEGHCPCEPGVSNDNDGHYVKDCPFYMARTQ